MRAQSVEPRERDGKGRAVLLLFQQTKERRQLMIERLVLPPQDGDGMPLWQAVEFRGCLCRPLGCRPLRGKLLLTAPAEERGMEVAELLELLGRDTVTQQRLLRLHDLLRLDVHKRPHEIAAHGGEFLSLLQAIEIAAQNFFFCLLHHVFLTFSMFI